MRGQKKRVDGQERKTKTKITGSKVEKNKKIKGKQRKGNVTSNV
jgi:hypothetical protein